MLTTTKLKLGQIGATLMMGAGLAAHLMRSEPPTGTLLLAGGALIFAGCRIATWLRARD